MWIVMVVVFWILVSILLGSIVGKILKEASEQYEDIQ
jgi:hypothetical protein